MRLLILFISFLISQVADSQIINASPPYRVRAAASCSGLLLDSLTATAQTAYSFRKLRCDYSGQCIRIRETATNNETDIGFVSNFLDTSAIKTFCATYSATSAAIVSVYDQSTNGRTMTQSTSGNQPLIYSSSAIIYDGGNTAAFFQTGGSNSLYTSSFTAYPDSITVNFVMRVSNNYSYNASVTKATGNIPGPSDMWTSNIYIGNGTVYNNGTASTPFSEATSMKSWAYKGKATRVQCYVNNTLTLNQAIATTYGDVNNALRIGTRGDGATLFRGYFLESITFAAIGESELSQLCLNQISFYGL